MLLLVCTTVEDVNATILGALILVIESLINLELLLDVQDFLCTDKKKNYRSYLTMSHSAE